MWEVKGTPVQNEAKAIMLKDIHGSYIGDPFVCYTTYNMKRIAGCSWLLAIHSQKVVTFLPLAFLQGNILNAISYLFCQTVGLSKKSTP